MVTEHGEEQENGALQFGEGGDPGDGFRVHGMEGEPEGGPESESGSAEGRDQQINQGDHGGVQEDVNEMPANGMLAKELVLRGIDEKLQRPIVVGADVGFRLGLTSKVPDLSREDLAKVLAFENDGILEDLQLVVGDELVAEGGGVEGEGEEDEDGEMEPVGAAGGGGEGWRGQAGWRRADSVGRGDLLRFFVFSGQGVGCRARRVFAAAGTV